MQTVIVFHRSPSDPFSSSAYFALAWLTFKDVRKKLLGNQVQFLRLFINCCSHWFDSRQRLGSTFLIWEIRQFYITFDETIEKHTFPNCSTGKGTDTALAKWRS